MEGEAGGVASEHDPVDTAEQAERDGVGHRVGLPFAHQRGQLTAAGKVLGDGEQQPAVEVGAQLAAGRRLQPEGVNCVHPGEVCHKHRLVGAGGTTAGRVGAQLDGRVTVLRSGIECCQSASNVRTAATNASGWSSSR